jgi:hypothetical protein
MGLHGRYRDTLPTLPLGADLRSYYVEFRRLMYCYVLIFVVAIMMLYYVVIYVLFFVMIWFLFLFYSYSIDVSYVFLKILNNNNNKKQYMLLVKDTHSLQYKGHNK